MENDSIDVPGVVPIEVPGEDTGIESGKDFAKDPTKHTIGVETLLGEPKKAIIKLAVPMMVAMLLHTVYNVADALWVSGLGADALAAVGFVFPFFIMGMSISTGLGVGASAAISRRIGAHDKEGADSVAVHAMVLLVISALAFTIPLILFVEPLFETIGVGDTLDMTVSYGRVIFAGSIFMFFAYVANAILRGEGDAKRAMYAMAVGAILNIILDPIFIYTLDMGVAGAAWATVVSMAVTSMVLFYWLVHKGDTYISFRFKGFRFRRNIIKDIFKVGVPASVLQLSMAISMLAINVIIVNVEGGNTDGVAVYTTGWRVATIAILPLMGIATAVVSVSGAAYGARSFEKLTITHLYSVKLGLIIQAAVAVATFALAPQIAAAFTRSEDAAHIKDDLTLFLRIICLFYPGVSLGMISSSVFQGIGEGNKALIATLFRSLIMTITFIYILAYVFDMGLVGVWWGITGANLLASAVVFLWARLHIKKMIREAAAAAIESKPVEEHLAE